MVINIFTAYRKASHIRGGKKSGNRALWSEVGGREEKKVLWKSGKVLAQIGKFINNTKRIYREE